MVAMFVPFAVDGITDVMTRLTPSFRTMQPGVDLAESPPITRQGLLFVGEFMVSPAFARFAPILRKPLIRLARHGR
jgi:hypothetical protein